MEDKATNNSLLLKTLERLESKVDNVSIGLIKNTEITNTHTGMLSDMKSVHDTNAAKITNIEYQLTRIESWKNGQILFQAKTNEDISGLKETLRPIKEDYDKRQKNDQENKRNVKEIIWRAIERVTLLIVGGTLMSWRTIIDNINK